MYKAKDIAIYKHKYIDEKITMNLVQKLTCFVFFSTYMLTVQVLKFNLWCYSNPQCLSLLPKKVHGTK